MAPKTAPPLAHYLEKPASPIHERCAEWIQQQTGYETDLETVKLVVSLYQQFQRSDFNKAGNQELRAAREAARAERAAKAEERRQASEAKKAERAASAEQRKADAEAKKAEKAAAKKAAPAKSAPAKATPAKAAPAKSAPAKAAAPKPKPRRGGKAAF